MDEQKTLYIILFALLIVGIIGIGYVLLSSSPNFEGPLTLSLYNATVVVDKNILLSENNYYVVKNAEYRMLYRSWNDKLLYKLGNYSKEVLEYPHIKVINLKSYDKNVVDYPYIVDANYELYTNAPDNIRLKLANILRENYVSNEVGFYNPNKYTDGIYHKEYDFSIYPPVEYDKNTEHVNLKLGNKHVPYKKVYITIYDKNNDILKLFAHPIDLKVNKIKNKYIITGQSPEDGLIEVEMLLKPNSVVGYKRYIENVEEKTISANNKYIIYNTIIKFIKLFLMGFILLLPVIIYIIYLKFGKEKNYTIPEYLSYVPNKDRKPWLVNLIFGSKFGNFDKNGFYATLLDLHSKGYIKIESDKIGDKGSVKIKILNKNLNNLDLYEQKVMAFLMRYSKDDVFNPDKISDLASKYKSKKDINTLRALKNEVDNIMVSPYINTERFLDSTGNKIIWAIFGISILLVITTSLLINYDTTVLYPDSRYLFGLSIVLLIQSIILLIAPKPLFGRWKGDYYKEKLQWDAFKKFLSDIAMIKKYKPEDVSIWKDWLIYGTALGVGKNVVSALDTLDIKDSIPGDIKTLTDNYHLIDHSFGHMHTSVYSAYSAVSAASSTSGGFSGGGFGAGGGFGGGGAGGR